MMKHITLTLFSLLFINAALWAQCTDGNCHNGQGTYVYKDGSRYVGDFKDGRAHGEGICYYASGDRYMGEWTNHNFNGKGVLYKRDGSVLKGIWQRGVLVEPEKDFRARPTTYKGNKSLNVVKKTPDRPKVWAVIVGVARYQHMQSLNYTDDDAYRMYAFFKSPEGGALPDNQVTILVDESATREKIIKSMEDMFAKADENDLILFYFSGHGEKQGLLPIDYNGYDNVLEHQTIRDVLAKSKAKYQICITDACYSGKMEETLTSKADSYSETEKSRIQQLYRSPLLDFDNKSLALLMSSQAQETSVENSGLRQGIFSHFLLRALKGEADNNNDRAVTLDEAFRYVQKHVKFYTGEFQTPILVGTHMQNQLVLSVYER